MIDRPARRRLGRRVGIVAVCATALTAAGCSDSLPSLPRLSELNPFAEKQVPLPGTRVPVLQPSDRIGGAELASAERPIILPAVVGNEGWYQPGGNAENAPGHLAFDATANRAWSVDAGSGSSSTGRLTATPIVGGGRIYVLDASSRVTAFATSGGSTVWRVSLAPPEERELEGYGGGLALDEGRLIAATGFGTVVALDAQTGKKLWERSIGVPVRASPTVGGGRIVVLATDGRVYALNPADGTELWQFRGLPEQTSLVASPSPAISGAHAIVPFPNGELVALKLADGLPAWTETLARTRTISAFAAMSDAARPAVADGIVYGIGHSGRMIATRAATGEQLWAISVPGFQTPWVAGPAVFVVDTQGQMIAIDRKDGKAIWTAKLPGEGRWSGPVLAGGQLWAASSKGKLVSVEAVTGRVSAQQEIGDPVFITPVVAGGRLYVLTDKARLIAYN